jgi:hypothetical protein
MIDLQSSAIVKNTSHRAHRSPSPGGEGRGEGELKLITFTFSTPLRQKKPFFRNKPISEPLAVQGFLSTFLKLIQPYSRPFKAIQGFLEKKDRLFSMEVPAGALNFALGHRCFIRCLLFKIGPGKLNQL